jgi:excisionase family DNA binding protein
MLTDNFHDANAETSFVKIDAATIEDMQKRISALENMIYQTKEIFTLEEAALYIGVSRSQMYRLTHLHMIPYFKPTGKLVFFEKAELNKWLRLGLVKSDDQIQAESRTALQRLAER